MPFDTLLIRTDGSDSAEAAARRGVDLPAQWTASVHGGIPAQEIVGNAADTIVRIASVPVPTARPEPSDRPIETDRREDV
ncbi:MAG: hypothetical protein ACQETB_02690 [Halobacteriota archaeon]